MSPKCRSLLRNVGDLEGLPAFQETFLSSTQLAVAFTLINLCEQ